MCKTALYLFEEVLWMGTFEWRKAAWAHHGYTIFRQSTDLSAVRATMAFSVKASETVTTKPFLEHHHDVRNSFPGERKQRAEDSRDMFSLISNEGFLDEDGLVNSRGRSRFSTTLKMLMEEL